MFRLGRNAAASDKHVMASFVGKTHSSGNKFGKMYYVCLVQDSTNISFEREIKDAIVLIELQPATEGINGVGKCLVHKRTIVH